VFSRRLARVGFNLFVSARRADDGPVKLLELVRVPVTSGLPLAWMALEGS